jgi:hypothetical protein
MTEILWYHDPTLILERLMKKVLSDDMLDGIVITLVILAIAVGVSYWLATMVAA